MGPRSQDPGSFMMSGYCHLRNPEIERRARDKGDRNWDLFFFQPKVQDELDDLGASSLGETISAHSTLGTTAGGHRSLYRRAVENGVWFIS